MMMKNPRKRRKAGPGPATASDPDIDPPTHHDLITCQIPVDTADGECHSGIRSAAAQYTECGGRSRHLYVYSQTLDCLLQKQCIPCLYKIFPDGRNDRYLLELLSSTTGIASKKGNGTSSVPAAVIKVAGAGTGTAVRQPTRRGEEYPSNTRPELCGRSGLMPVYVSKEATGRGSGSGALSSLQLADLMTNVYGSCIAAADSQSEHTVLTVGDGDFTFSLSLAETDRFQQYIDCSSDKSSSSSTLSGIIGCHQRGRTGCSRLKLTATSHESYQSICSTYPQAEDTLHRLKYLGATVLHDVDATDLHLLHHGSSTDLLQHGSPIAAEGSRTFDFIIWNFPCVSLPAGADGQTSELEQNRTLLRRFFSNIRPFLTADRGEVHITHKTIVSTYCIMKYSTVQYMR